MTISPDPFTSLREDAPAFWSADILWLLHASAEQTNGLFSLLEELCPQGSGAPPHVHEWSDESFYLLDGAITFLLGERTASVAAGGFVFVPRGTVHGFRVDTPTARILNTYTPPSWEAAVVALASPAPSRTLPPPGLAMPDRARSAAMFKRYGMRPVPGPDPLRANGG